MYGTIIVLDDVATRDIKPLKDELHKHAMARVIHADIKSTSVCIHGQVYDLKLNNIDPELELTPAQLHDASEADDSSFASHLLVALGLLKPVAMVVMPEHTWQDWGTQLRGGARIFANTLERMYPYAQLFVVHPGHLLEAV